MTTRRDFLASAASGAIFCSCALQTAYGQGLAQSIHPHAPVTIRGKRARAIDIHAHCNFKEVIPFLGGDTSPLTKPARGQEENFLGVEQRFQVMDAMGIDMEVLSIVPFWYDKDRENSQQIVKIQNEKLAELCAAHPDRFSAFASLSLQTPDLAVQELEDAVRRLGLKGAAIGHVVAGVEFSDPKFHPVWAKAQELDVPLFIHPAALTPGKANRLVGNGWLGNTIGNPLETTITLSHLIMEGTLDLYPELKLIAAHGGGFLGFADRADQACAVSPMSCDPAVKLKKHPSEYLKQLYYDSLVFTPEALRDLVARVGIERVMIGSDYPYPWSLNPVDQIFAVGSLSDADKTAILNGNAIRLLKLGP